MMEKKTKELPNSGKNMWNKTELNFS